jgi:hypothetical protein
MKIRRQFQKIILSIPRRDFEKYPSDIRQFLLHFSLTIRLRRSTWYLRFSPSYYARLRDRLMLKNFVLPNPQALTRK